MTEYGLVWQAALLCCRTHGGTKPMWAWDWWTTIMHELVDGEPDVTRVLVCPEPVGVVDMRDVEWERSMEDYRRRQGIHDPYADRLLEATRWA